MKTDFLYNKCGVYKITCLINNKIYIGSSQNLGRRRCAHFCHLKTGKHGNRLLQRSYNKHGKENFIFDVIEFCDKDVKLQREDFWRKELNSLTPNGFDIALVSGSPSDGNNKTEERRLMISKFWKLIDPTGSVIEFFNLSYFAEKNNLSKSSLNSLVRGVVKSYKGYRKFDEKFIGVPYNPEDFPRIRTDPKIFKFLNPKGDIVETDNLSQFCKDNSIDEDALRKVLNGFANQKFSQYHGYRPYDDNLVGTLCAKRHPMYRFSCPEGNIIDIDNLRDYCIENNLSYKCMVRLINGHRKSHMGWVLIEVIPVYY